MPLALLPSKLKSRSRYTVSIFLFILFAQFGSFTSLLSLFIAHSTLFSFTVPPINVKIRVRHEKLRPGQTATLTCESDSSFPYSKLAWLRSNGQPMVALSNGTSPGTHSGLVTKSTLQMQATLDLHGQVVICQASNGIGPHIEDAITIEVLCKF